MEDIVQKKYLKNHLLKLEAIDAANQYGMASMCMLGNSVFAIGDTDALCKTLTNFGRVYVCLVDEYGARIITSN